MRLFFIPLLLFKTGLPHDSNKRGNTAALVLKSAFITKLSRRGLWEPEMVCLIVKERHSNQEPYSEISKALLTTLKHTNVMQHNSSSAFLLSCIQAPVSSERCRKKTTLPALPAKNSQIFP